MLTEVSVRATCLWVTLLLVLKLPLHAQVAGSLDLAFHPDVPSAAGGNVNSVVVQTDGKILIGGEFTTMNVMEYVRGVSP